MKDYWLKEKRLDKKYGWNKQRLTCLDYLFNEVFKFESYKNKQYSFTATDIDYDSDEYYPDRHQYIEFKISELPMWKFGIWFNTPEYNKETKQYDSCFEGEFFAQVERFIDKFKPTRSPYCTKFKFFPEHTVDFEDGPELIKAYISGEYDIQDTLRFMLDEPALAFCRDICYWNYNTEHHTRAEAIKKMNKIIHEQDVYDANKKYMGEIVLRFFRDLRDNKDKYFKDYIKDVILTDISDNSIPSRGFYLYWPEGEDGHDYSFVPKEDMTSEGYAYWKTWLKETKKLGKKLKVYFWEFETIDIYCLSLVSDKKRWRYLKKLDEPHY